MFRLATRGTHEVGLRLISTKSLSLQQIAGVSKDYSKFQNDSTDSNCLALTVGVAAALASTYSLNKSGPTECRGFFSLPSKQGVGDDTEADVQSTEGKSNEDPGHYTEAVEEDENPLWRSKQSRRFEKKYEETAIFSGSSNLPLAESIADCLGSKLGNVRLARFADGEVNLQFLDSLRGKDVYLIQPTSSPVNEHLMELLLMISTARRSSAKKITAVIPYYGYARQDRKLNSRVPISAADVAKMIETMGVDRVISVDLHCGQIQGFFGPRVPVDNLEALMIGLDYFLGKKLDNPVVVSPDAGGVYRARKFQEGLKAKGLEEAGIAMLIKQRQRPNEIERMDLVGNVKGCDAIIVDDMIDTAGTLCEAATQLRAMGAKRVFAFATHGIFSGPALKRIEESVLEEVVVSDTIKQRSDVFKSSRITQLSIGESQAINMFAFSGIDCGRYQENTPERKFTATVRLSLI